MTNTYLSEPRDMPLQFQDSTGEWHLFGEQWFARNSEHVDMQGESALIRGSIVQGVLEHHARRLADLFE